MANPRDAFALLLTALDEKQSADAINKQLKNDIPKMLEKLKIELDLPEDSFKAIETFFDKGALKAKEMRGELEKAIRLSTELYDNRPVREETLNMAQTDFGMVDPKITKQTIDAMTNQIKTLTVESTTAEGQIKRMMFALEDGVLTNVSDVTIVTKINEELKATDKELNKTQAEFLKLMKLEETRGSDANRLSRIKELENKQLELQKQRVEQINQAARDGLISEEQKSALLREHDVLIEQQVQEYSRLKEELDASQQFKDSKAALTELKKDYKEYLQLQQREGQEDFTEADREKLEFLRGRIANSKELVQLYPQLKQEFEKFATAEEKFQNQKAAKAESKVVEKEVKAIIKLYDDLQKKQIALYKEEQKAQSGAKADTYREDIKLLEQQIALKQKSLQTTMQTTDGERQAVQGLNQIEEHAHKREVERARIEEDLLNEKRAHIEKVAGTLRQNQNVDTSFIKLGDTLDKTSPQLQKFAKDLYSNQAALRNVSIETDKYGNSYYKMSITQDKGADTLKHTTVTVDRLTGSMRELDTITAKNVSRSMTFATQIGHAAKKMAVWGVAARALYGTMREVEEGVRFIGELDKDITQAAIVTGQSREQVQGLANDYANLGIEMGKTVTEISKVNTELLRQGLTIKESSERLQTILKLSATGQITTEESLRVVTTAVNAMQESHTHAADVILRASNISASSVEQLGEAFTKTASSADATGMEIEQVTGILATMLEVTQEGPSQLGTSLKTILARFSRVNEETGEFNDNLNQVQGAIESVGVKFVDADGQIRNTYDILSDLSEIWPTLTKNQQAYIATTAAGVRMQNRFFAVMNNFDRVKTITEDTAQATGTMNRAYLTYMDSVEASSNRARAAVEELWINTIQSDWLKTIYDMTTGLVKLIDTIGLFNVALAGAGAYILKKTGLIHNLITATAKLQGTEVLTKSFGDALVKTLAAGSAEWQKLSAAAGGHLRVSTKMLGTFGALKKSAISLIGPYALMAAKIGLVVAAAGLLVKAISSIIKAQKEQKKALIDLNNRFLDERQNYAMNKTALKDMSDTYQDYVKKIEQSGLSAKSALTPDEYQDFIQLQEEIQNIIPDVKTKMDAYGNTMLDFSAKTGTAVEQYEKMVDLLRQDFLLGVDDILKNQSKEIDDIAKQIADKQTELSGGFRGDRVVDDNRRRQLEKEIELLKERQKMEQSSQIATWIQKNEAEVAAGIKGVESLTEAQKTLLMSTEIAHEAIGKTGPELESWLLATVTASSETVDGFDELDVAFNSQMEAIDELNQRYKDGLITQEAYNEAFDVLADMDMENVLNDLKEQGVDVSNLSMAYELLKIRLQGSKIETEAQQEEFVDLVAIIEKAKQATSDYSDILEEYTETQGLSLETKQKIIDEYPELIQYMNDEKLLIEKVKEAQLEADEKIRQSYEEKIIQQLTTDKDFYAEKKQDILDFFADESAAMRKQLDAAETVAEARALIEGEMLSNMSGMWKEYFDALQKGDHASMALAEVRIEKLKNNEIGKWQPIINAYNKLNAIIAEEVSKPGWYTGTGRTDNNGTASTAKENEQIQIQIDLYAKLNAELEQIQSVYGDIDKARDLLDDDDTLGQIKLQQQYNQVRELEIAKLNEIYEAKLKAMQPDYTLLRNLGILDKQNNLTDDYITILQKVNQGLIKVEGGTERVEQAFDNWMNGLHPELMTIEQQIADIRHQTVLTQNEIQVMSNKMATAIHQEAFAREQSAAASAAQDRVNAIEKEISATERLIDSIKETKDRITERYKAEKEALEEKIDALKEVAKEEDREAERLEHILNIEKQREVLANAKKNRNLQVLTEEGQWEWIADPRIIAEEQEKLEKLTQDYADWELKLQREKAEESIRLEIEEATIKYNNDIAAQDRKITSNQKHLDRLQTQLERANDKLSEIQRLSYEEWLEEQEKWEDEFEVSTELFLEIAEELYGTGFANMLESVLGLAGGYGDLESSIWDVIAAMEELAELEAVGIPKGASKYFYTSSTGSRVDTKTAWTEGLGSASGKQAEANVARLKSDANFRELEKARAESVIAEKKKKGEDTSLQEKYLRDISQLQYGGEIEFSGLHLTEFHGTKNDPEWVFNSTQLDATLKRAISTALQVNSQPPSISETTQSNTENQTFNISKLEFPNVKDAEEIKQAILNLPNLARMKVRTS